MTSTESQVRLQTELTDSIATEQGLKQGDGLAPLLFNLALEFILRRLSIDLEGTLEYKSTQILAYADDTAIISGSLSDAMEIYNELAIEAKEMGLEINTNTTKLLIQSRKVDKQIHSITLMGETIEAVKDFVYLGSNLSANGSEENDIRRRIGQANRVFYTATHHENLSNTSTNKDRTV
jgi:sorting nexin-29